MWLFFPRYLSVLDSFLDPEIYYFFLVAVPRIFASEIRDFEQRWRCVQTNYHMVLILIVIRIFELFFVKYCVMKYVSMLKLLNDSCSVVNVYE